MTTTGTATVARPPAPSAAERRSAVAGPIRSRVPFRAGQVGVLPAGLHRTHVPQPVASSEPARLDEATRRLLRVPSFVAECASAAARRSAGGRVESAAPVRPARRRTRRTHTRRPPSGLLGPVPALGMAGACDQGPARVVEPGYRMTRRHRLALTLTVFGALVVVAATTVTSGGPRTTADVVVVSGDTLWSIAQRTAPDDEVWSVIDEISALNGLTGVDLVPGQVLVVPVG